ncbi:two-component system, chemotaxis family, sensor kinase CheA [Treponema bryantii]|uniref:histidine kinase n=1 Tax=Treponema bryantii TaxID=163 RepID=A0A1I3L9W5_9SPIR|nr:response regulator [Treponema bryantii]SFI81340.1 two-component system, chemotaxis family, sensor kinase CheA [Treponema bryantii]
MNLDKNLFKTDYISEAREILDSLDDIAIVASKEKRNADYLKEILRLLHTLKGSSRMMEYVQIEKVVNHLETVFKNIQSNKTEISNKIIQLLMGVNNVLHKVIDDIEDGADGSFDQYEEVLQNIDLSMESDDYNTDFSVKQGAVNSENGAAEENSEDSAGSQISEENAEFFHDSQTIKVQITQIDSILQSLDKLIMRQIKLKNEIEVLKGKSDASEFQAFQELSENISVLENQSVDIQKNIISLRMLPFDMILRPIKRSIVAESLKAGKNIEFDIPQSEITIDKFILEKLPAVLIHLVRNSIDHGIESPEERKALGKPETGTISISVSQVSNRIFVNVKDDGHGIDYEKIRTKALRLFPERESEILAADSTDLLQFIFASGFSTKDEQTELSGRGIGLDVVRTEMDKLKGKITVYSELNKGTNFELSLPASLATQDGLFVSVSDSSYLILSHYIREILTVNKSDFLELQHGPVINVHNELVPIFDFDIINANSAKRTNTKTEVSVVILEYLNRKIGVMVDKILHYGTVVIKPVPPLLKDFNALQGVVFDENYRIIPVLNIPDTMRRFRVVNVYDVKNLEVHKMPKIHSVLVVDDSHTTRHIEQIILEAENYNVSTAVDGIDALEKMKQHRFDLVVTDVKMPRMDGFVLLHNMRHKEELKNIPVIMVSSVFESDTLDKAKNLGAQGYIVKSDFERENLTAKVKELLHD